MDVLEGLDGQLAVQHEGQIIPTQKAPQRPNILRDFTERTVPTPSPHIDSNGLGRRWVDKLAQLDVELSQDTADGNGAGRVRKAVSPRRRKPTHFRRRDGKRCGKRSARGCPFVGSPGSWAYTETP